MIGAWETSFHRELSVSIIIFTSHSPASSVSPRPERSSTTPVVDEKITQEINILTATSNLYKSYSLKSLN